MVQNCHKMSLHGTKVPQNESIWYKCHKMSLYGKKAPLNEFLYGIKSAIK